MAVNWKVTFFGGICLANCISTFAQDPSSMFNDGLASAPKNQELCSRKAQCVNLPVNATCFGTQLPYSSVSFSFTGHQHYWSVQDRLSAWSGLMNVPKCWAAIQPLLCAVYLPKCEGGLISKVPHHLCKGVRNPCRIVDTVHEWPDFLKCHNETVFTSIASKSDCRDDDVNEARRILKFNSTATCLQPYLLRTSEPLAHYGDVDECGLSCQDPRFTQAEHNTTRGLVKGGFSTSIVFNLISGSTLFIQGPKNSRGRANLVPNQIMFFMNVCYVMVSTGMLSQFLSNQARSDIVCRGDGTRRIGEPGAGENFSCVIVFILVYYFELAFGLWLVLLTYAWSISLQVTAAKEKLEQQLVYFHIIAWTGPLVFTIAAIFVNGIDGYSLSGVCHVSRYFRTEERSEPDPTRVIWFILMPYFITICATCAFLVKVFYYLYNLSKSDPTSNEIRSNQARIGFTIVPIVGWKIISLLLSIYMVTNTSLWDASLDDFLVCEAKSGGEKDLQCDLKNRPNLLIVQLHLLSLFMPGLFMVPLMIRKTTVDTWREFIFRNILQKFVRLPDAKDGCHIKQKIKKHQVVAQAYARRHEFRETGRLSLTLNSVHDEGASVSEEFSSTWAQALPRLVQRRNALVGAEQLGLRRSASIDSDLSLSRSYSVQLNRYSCVDSRRHSIAGESQFSLQQSELDHLENLYEVSLAKSSKRSRSKPKLFSRYSATKRRSYSSRQSSFTSQENNVSLGSLASQTIPAVTLDPAMLQATFDSTLTKKNNPLVGGEFYELEEKLRTLANASRTSHETLLTDSKNNINVVSINVPGNSSANTATDIAVQTSLTDLGNLSRRPPDVKEVATQCSQPNLTIDTTTTTSSSQTEVKALLMGYPVEAHVTQIRVLHDQSSGDSSSIPSSYDREYERSLTKKLKLLNSEVEPPTFPMPLLPLSNSGLRDVHHHNRGRRGGIVDVHSAAAIVPEDIDSLTMDELELKARTPGGPVTISTPSS
jgi:smoothened protein